MKNHGGLTEAHANSLVKAVVARILSAVVSIGSGGLAYRAGSVLFEKDDTLNGGDPFAIVLVPFLLVFAVLILVITAAFAALSVLSAAYAIHPPLARWLWGLTNETENSPGAD